MFFAKGEINMNNIYKVIWSKAKNCYVVASEIARSHTKSASGSEKIGGGTRRKLLASLMALSLLCGGLGVAEATVHVNEGTGVTSEVYTTGETYNRTEADAKYAKANDVTANTTEIAGLKTAVGDAGSGLTKAVADQQADIAVNKANITALQNELGNKADTTALNNKADKAITLTGYGITDAYTKDEVNNALNDKANKATVNALVGRVGELATTVGNKADKADLDTANGEITALKNKTANLSDDGKELKDMTTVSGTTVSGDNVKAGELTVTGEIKDGAGVTTTLAKINDSMTQTATNTGNIANLKTKTDGQQTAIDDLKKKTTKIDYDAANDTTSINGIKVGDQVDMGGKKLTNVGTINGIDIGDAQVDMKGKNLTGVGTINGTEIGMKVDGNYIHQDSSIWGNMNNVDTQVKTNADNIKTNTTAITTLNTKVGEIDDRTGGITRNTEDTQTTIENSVKVDNQGNVKDVKGLSAETITTGALTVTGASDLKGDVTLGTPNGTNTVTVNGTANFHEEVKMNNGLNVTNGETNLKKTTVDGDLKVTGTITTEKMVFGDKATNNYTEIDHGKVTSKNQVVTGTGEIISSSSTFDVEKNEVGFGNGITGDQSYHKQTSDGIIDNVNDQHNSNNRTQTKTETKDIITDENGNTSTTSQTASKNETSLKDKDGKNTNTTIDTAKGYDKTIEGENGKTSTKQEAGSISSTVYDKDGNVKASSEMKEDGSISNNATGDMTNTVGGKLTTTVTGQATEDFKGGLDTTVTGAENHTVTGKQTNTVKGGQENIISGGQINNITGDQTTTVTGKVTETYKAGQETNVTGDKKTTVTGKTTEEYKGGLETTVTGDEKHNVTGNQTTNVTGDILNTANSITDKVGDHTRVLDNEGITDTVGGSTFKQRIDKIMMESKDVSIKAEETLTNEAKVITNKASEVINNEAINIKNTATGIITSKASEIKNQADKLISNKVGENTWENMEDGKITTSIKDGAKQNLTQSDAAGTTQSTVDGGKSTVTIQNADGLADAVTDGTNTSVQNQTASAIAAAVKDGAGNENGSVATATTSANTIKSGSKANTVISTADGTSFINSEAAAPVTGESGAGTAVNTTIKGNTITTGKVTMDYAEVMKDLGVRGNANITGKTTTGSLEVTGTSTLKGDVTMGSNATVKKDFTVEGNTNLKNTKVDGTLDVTQKATFGDSVSIAKDLSVDGNATIKGDVTAKSYKVGDKTYISAAGINANDQKITNVADGSISEGSKDAVNGGQLYTVKNDLEGKVNKVGANAAAMANLHPMEFDPDSKWNIAAAIGNYGSETAAALGAFYRPNDDVMVNLSTAFGTGENMVGGGVSVRLGKGGNKLSREETNVLKAQVADLTARMDALLSVLNPNMSKDFPDVPENHWAYEAVSRLAGNDIVQGYPDGEFHGERTMTRYEMAEIIYNALSRGAEAEKELVEEFKPELQAMAASEKATAEKAEG